MSLCLFLLMCFFRALLEGSWDLVSKVISRL